MHPIIAIDSETDLVRQGLLAPPLVCVTCADGKQRTSIDRWDTAKAVVVRALTLAADGKAIIVGQRIAYDMAVFMAQWPDLTALILQAYDADGITDTRIRERLLDIAKGTLQGKGGPGYSLNALAEKYTGMKLTKGADGWQLRYGELRNVPLDQWPTEAIKYPKTDAEVLIPIHAGQRTEADALIDMPGIFVDEYRQARKAFALHVMACRGIEVDTDSAVSAMLELVLERDRLGDYLRGCDLLSETGSISVASTREIVEAFADGDEDLPRTPKGKVSTRSDVILRVGDPRLDALVDYRRNQKLRNTYLLPLLLHGRTGPIQPQMETLLETGRTSMYGGWVGREEKPRGFSLQTMPRSGPVRSCFVARKGFEFVDIDYSVAEMRSLGQVMWDLFGEKFSPLAELFRNDRNADCHLALAADMLGITLDEAKARRTDPEIKNARQRAKAPNFGYPGGMGVERFIATEEKKYWDSGKTQGSLWSYEAAAKARDVFVARWKMSQYFNHIARLVDGFQGGKICQIFSGRWRGGLGFSDAANGYFQALTADGSGLALWEICKATLVGDLVGCGVVNFVHDNITLEVPEGAGEIASRRMTKYMIESMEKVTPDVPAAVDVTISRSLGK